MSNTLAEFKNLVGTKFEMYNSLFTSLPFHKVEKTGILLSLFLLHCEDGFSNNQSPAEIIDTFFKREIKFKRNHHRRSNYFRKICLPVINLKFYIFR